MAEHTNQRRESKTQKVKIGGRWQSSQKRGALKADWRGERAESYWTSAEKGTEKEGVGREKKVVRREKEKERRGTERERSEKRNLYPQRI